MEAADLSIPIYLNQRIVFDLLAIMEGGFSQMSNIRTFESESEQKGHKLGGMLGVSNVFALLGVNFGGEKDSVKKAGSDTEVATQKVHTPTSLFSKLRSLLNEKKLLKNLIVNPELFDSMKSGNFVEFAAILRKNPLVETIETFKELMDIYLFFEEKPQKTSKGGKGVKQTQFMPDKRMDAQLKGMLESLTANSVELVGEIVGLPGAKAVLSSELDYFSDPTASEIIDGEFRVLGKATRHISTGSEEAINLLRKTKFRRFPTEIFSRLRENLGDVEQFGIKIPELVMEIAGPAIQVIPIGIFA